MLPCLPNECMYICMKVYNIYTTSWGIMVHTWCSHRKGSSVVCIFLSFFLSCFLFFFKDFSTSKLSQLLHSPCFVGFHFALWLFSTYPYTRKKKTLRVMVDKQSESKIPDLLWHFLSQRLSCFMYTRRIARLKEAYLCLTTLVAIKS